jgi:hypothetical protein
LALPLDDPAIATRITCGSAAFAVRSSPGLAA